MRKWSEPLGPDLHLVGRLGFRLLPLTEMTGVAQHRILRPWEDRPKASASLGTVVLLSVGSVSISGDSQAPFPFSSHKLRYRDV